MTPFAKKVYQVVLSIPFGQTRTYKWVAQKAGNRKAHRAVGTILHKNPFPLIIPCHRVIKSNNISGSYLYGVNVKKALIEMENAFAKCLTSKK